MCIDHILVTYYGCSHEQHVGLRYRGPKCEYALFAGKRCDSARVSVEERSRFATLCKECKEHYNSSLRGTGWRVFESINQKRHDRGPGSTQVVTHKVIDAYAPGANPPEGHGWGHDEHGYYRNYQPPEPPQSPRTASTEIQEIARVIADCDKNLTRKWKLHTPR